MAAADNVAGLDDRMVKLILFLTAIAWSSLPCSSRSEAGTVSVVTGIRPYAEIVRFIAADHATVTSLVRPGESYHLLEPTPRQVKAILDARLFFSTGEPFENLLARKIMATSGEVRVVNLLEAIPSDELIDSDCLHPNEKSTHTHGIDPHIWLSPHLVAGQARVIAHELGELDTAHRAFYDSRFALLIDSLNRIDQAIRATLSGCAGMPLLVYHASFAYFCREYGLRQLSLEIEGKEPGARQMIELAEQVKRENIRTLFVQPQYPDKTARVFATHAGVRVQPIDPLAEGFPGSLLYMAQTIATTLTGEKQ